MASITADCIMGSGNDTAVTVPSVWDTITNLTCNLLSCRPPWAEPTRRDDLDRDVVHLHPAKHGGNLCSTPSLTHESSGGSLPPVDSPTAEKTAFERANALQKSGAEANRKDHLHEAFQLFERAHRLMPRNPVHLLSAANMKLKMGLASPTTRLSPACSEALELYERASRLQLTEAQRSMVETKRGLAE